MDSTIDVHACHNLKLMADFTERPTGVEESTADGVSQGRGMVRIRRTLEHRSKRLIINVQKVFHLPNSLSNLVRLDLLNDAGVYYDNKRQAIYNKISQ